MLRKHCKDNRCLWPVTQFLRSLADEASFFLMPGCDWLHSLLCRVLLVVRQLPARIYHIQCIIIIFSYPLLCYVIQHIYILPCFYQYLLQSGNNFNSNRILDVLLRYKFYKNTLTLIVLLFCMFCTHFVIGRMGASCISCD